MSLLVDDLFAVGNVMQCNVMRNSDTGRSLTLSSAMDQNSESRVTTQKESTNPIIKFIYQ